MSRQRSRKTAAPPAAPQPAAPWRRFAPALIIVAVAAAYANSLHGPFLLDDQRAIVENQTIHSLQPLSTPLHPPRQNPVTGRPLVNLSFAFNYAVGGLRVEGFHLLNVAIHALAALALFGVVRRTFARTAVVGGEPAATGLALAAALIWAVHPLNTEAVNYITQRTELMMGLFFLVTVASAIRALAKSAGRWEWIAAASAFCAVASKETALTLPLIVMAWDRAFQFSSLREAWLRRWRLYVMVTASWLLFAWFARQLPFFVEGGFEVQVSRGTYLLHQASMVMQYLALSVWPHGLVFDYGAVPPTTIGAVLPALIAVAVLVLATLVALVRAPTIGFWGAWFWITLAPASSLIPIPTEVGAERRMYLPLVGVVALAVLGIHALLRRLSAAERRQQAAVALAAVVVLAMGGLTVRRNMDYRSRLAIWQDVLDRRPHPRAHEHVSIALRDANRLDESIAHLRIAAPESSRAQHALASALLEHGEIPEAIVQFRELVAKYPKLRDIVQAREEFAVALARAGDADGVLEQYRAITTGAPDYARGHVGLADALAHRNDLNGAIDEYRQALRIQPNNVVALAALGQLLAARGDRAEALTVLRRAVELEPRALPPRRHIVQLLAEARDFAAMEREATTLVQYAPTDPEARNFLGIALASQQRFEPARAQFAEALRLDPAHHDARANLARTDALLARARR